MKIYNYIIIILLFIGIIIVTRDITIKTYSCFNNNIDNSNEINTISEYKIDSVVDMYKDMFMYDDPVI